MMAVATECQTPGALFHTRINDDGLSVAIDFGRKISLSEEAAEELEVNVHNALELALNRYYREAAK
jgi:hypothetical protein